MFVDYLLNMDKKEYENLISDFHDCMISAKNREVKPDIQLTTNQDNVAHIDENIINIIEYLNQNGFETISCCSGIISEHYDMRKIKNKGIKLNDIYELCKYRERICYPTPYIRLKPKFHDWNEDKSEFTVHGDYYELQESIGSSHRPDEECTWRNIGNERTPEWRLEATAEYPVFLYEVKPRNSYRFFHWADSFEEYENLIKLSNKRLFERIKNYKDYNSREE